MRYGHVEQSLKQQTMSARLALDCNLIVEILSVRILGFPCYLPCASIFCHQIDPGRASKQHTAECKLATPARGHIKIPPDRVRTDCNLQGVQNVFQQRSRHFDMDSADGIGCLGVPSITGRQIQYRSRRAGETRCTTLGAATTIPKAERLLRQGGCGNPRVAQAGTAALTRDPRDLASCGNAFAADQGRRAGLL